MRTRLISMNLGSFTFSGHHCAKYAPAFCGVSIGSCLMVVGFACLESHVMRSGGGGNRGRSVMQEDEDDAIWWWWW